MEKQNLLVSLIKWKQNSWVLVVDRMAGPMESMGLVIDTGSTERMYGLGWLGLTDVSEWSTIL